MNSPVPYPWRLGFWIKPLSDVHAMVVQTSSCHLYEQDEIFRRCAERIQRRELEYVKVYAAAARRTIGDGERPFALCRHGAA